MRHLATICAIALFFLAPDIHAQFGSTPDTTKGDWYQQYPGLDFSNPQNFYAANDHTLYILFRGYLLRSTDAGATWAKKDLPGCFRVDGAQFLDDTLGWLVGNAGAAYKTTDGGDTWIYVSTLWSAVDFRYVSFISPMVGYIGGTYGVTLKTTDGGDSWIPQDYWHTEDPSRIACVKAVDDSTVWIFDVQLYSLDGNPGHVIYLLTDRTTDGGKTWNFIDTVSFDLTFFLADYAEHFMACSADNAAYYVLTDSVFSSPQNLNYDSVLFRRWRVETDDGNQTWHNILLDTSETEFGDTTKAPVVNQTEINPLRFPRIFTCSTGWALDEGKSHLYRSVSLDTLMWVERTTPCKGCKINYCDFIDTNTGWCVLNEGDTALAVYRTTDGATTWQLMSTHSIKSGTLQDVCFVNPDTGWAVGTANGIGIVLHTTNAGGNWNAINSNTNISSMSDLHQVQFINALTGWALGDSIYQTTDGGVMWKVDPVFPLDSSRPNIKYVRVQFVDSLTGWAVRSDWLTYRTIDGGASWQVAHLADTAVDITISKAVGKNMVVSMGLLDSTTPYEFRIIDPQGHWQEFPIQSDTTGGGVQGYLSVPAVLTFLDTTRGWFLDRNSDLYYTPNRGQTWKFITGLNAWSPPTNALFVDTSDGWLLSQAKRTYGDPTTNDSFYVSPPGIVELTGDLTSGIPQGCITEQLNGIAFLGDSLGWAVGDNLAIYHYYVPASARPHYAPEMVLSTPSIDFGTILPGTSKTDTFIVYNEGTSPLYLWNSWITPDSMNAFISVNILTGDSSAHVLPGDSLLFAVAFNPQIAIPFYGTLYLASNADTQQVTLHGVGGFPQGVYEPVLESAELQNYPNPFTRETVVRYESGTVTDATLGIYDVMGREVRDLTHEMKESGGYINIQTASLPSGMYYCVLTRGAERIVQRMIKME